MRSISTDTVNLVQKEAPPATQEETVPLTSTTEEEDDQDHKRLWDEVLEEAQQAMAVYDRTAKKGNKKDMEAAAAEVAKKMRNVAATHTDPDVQKEWNDKADNFAKASKVERDIMFNDIMNALTLLVTAPIFLMGAFVFAVGGVFYGAGTIFKELGTVLTCGKIGLLNGEFPADSADEEQEPLASSS